MSIALLATSALAARTSTVAPVGQTVTAAEGLIAITAGVVGLIIAAFAGALRPRSVVGPARLDRQDSPLSLWLIVLLAISLAAVLPAAYATALHSEEISKLNDEQRNEWRLPARDVVIVASALPIISTIVVILADRKSLRGGARQLGLGADRVGTGIIFGVIGAAAAVPLTLATVILVQAVWARLDFPRAEEHQLITHMHALHSIGMRVLIVFAAVIAAPVYEELLFRGHLQTAFAHSLRALRHGSAGSNAEYAPDPAWLRWSAIAFAGVLFAAIHASGVGSLWMLPPLFLLALCFGYAYERTGNLWTPIVMHAAFNATSIALALTGGG